MEGLYAIFITPESLTDPGAVGYVLAESWTQAYRRAQRIITIGFAIRVEAL